MAPVTHDQCGRRDSTTMRYISHKTKVGSTMGSTDHKWLVCPDRDRGKHNPSTDGWRWFVYADGWNRVVGEGVEPTIEAATRLARAGTVTL